VQAGIAEVVVNGNLRGKPTLIVAGRNDALIPVNHNSRAYTAYNRVTEGASSKLRYIEVTNAQHFDAFNALSGFDTRYVPLHVYFNRAMDAMWAHLKNGTALPPEPGGAHHTRAAACPVRRRPSRRPTCRRSWPPLRRPMRSALPAPRSTCPTEARGGMSFTSHYIACEGRELHYTEWGAAHGPQAETVIAWHGLARTGRDMDDIAEHLAQRYRVICPDTLGRGLSQWSPAPEAEYCLAFYVKLAVALLDQLGLERVHWLGTSMGGAIGTLAAAGPLRGRITRLVLNDNGPSLAPAAIERIRSLCRQPAGLCTVGELEQLLPHRLQALWLAERRAVAAAHRDLGAPPARRPRDAALRPGDGAAVRHHPERLRAVGRLGRAGSAGAVPARRTLRPAAGRHRRRCASGARGRWW
jgi:pimeloyl-ACP methyl ester carboxylesterase